MATMNKGMEFEGIIGDLFGRMGYDVERNKLMKGKSGAVHEIDVYGERGMFRKRQAAVECKYKQNGDKVRKSDVANFLLKLDDLDIKNGYMVTNSRFSSYAESTAGTYNIELIDSGSLAGLLRTYKLERYLDFVETYEQSTLTKMIISTIDLLDGLGVIKKPRKA